MEEDDVRAKSARGLPFGVEQAAHQVPVVFEQLEARPEAGTAFPDHGLRLGRIEHRKEFGRQCREGYIFGRGHVRELGGRDEQHLVPELPQGSRESEIRLRIAPCAEGVNGNPHLRPYAGTDWDFTGSAKIV